MPASTQIEKGTWSLDPQPTICPVPCRWSFVEQSKSNVLLGEHDIPDVTHILGRVKEDDVPI